MRSQILTAMAEIKRARDISFSGDYAFHGKIKASPSPKGRAKSRKIEKTTVSSESASPRCGRRRSISQKSCFDKVTDSSPTSRSRSVNRNAQDRRNNTKVNNLKRAQNYLEKHSNTIQNDRSSSKNSNLSAVWRNKSKSPQRPSVLTKSGKQMTTYELNEDDISQIVVHGYDKTRDSRYRGPPSPQIDSTRAGFLLRKTSICSVHAGATTHLAR